jgi:hypothetical protein
MAVRTGAAVGAGLQRHWAQVQDGEWEEMDRQQQRWKWRRRGSV